MFFLILFRRVKQHSVKLTTTRGLTTVRAVLRIAFNLFLIGLNLTRRQILSRQQRQIRLLLGTLNSNIVRARSTRLPISVHNIK